MNQRKIIITIISIIIFFIILFLLIRQFGLINVKIPTGNVDIFDINFIVNNNCNHIDLDENIKNNILIYDEQVKYSDNIKLNIFTHKSYYVKNDVIAPDTQNSYQFIIRNNNEFAIKYNLKMEENNIYNINMKYRLKLDGKYILGNDKEWVTANELVQNELVLADKSYNVYTLDWKWFESDNETDTKIGTNIDAKYQLNISFLANRY